MHQLERLKVCAQFFLKKKKLWQSVHRSEALVRAKTNATVSPIGFPQKIFGLRRGGTVPGCSQPSPRQQNKMRLPKLEEADEADHCGCIGPQRKRPRLARVGWAGEEGEGVNGPPLWPPPSPWRRLTRSTPAWHTVCTPSRPRCKARGHCRSPSVGRGAVSRESS